jgi:hypothetical protein
MPLAGAHARRIAHRRPLGRLRTRDTNFSVALWCSVADPLSLSPLLFGFGRFLESNLPRKA